MYRLLFVGGFEYIEITKQHDERGGGSDLIDWSAVRREYEETAITMRSLAEKYGIKPSTLRSRKNREDWKRSDATQRNESSDVATDRPGGQKGNQNAKGNKGGPPPDNKNAVSHGLFAKWLPEDTKQIMAELYTSEPEDIIWNNIIIQYTAIIRSQKIMYVQDEYDHLSNTTKADISPMFMDREGNPIRTSESREWHMAFDRQEKFMSAQSRAMGTLSNLMKQFVALADERDERRKKLEMMDAKLKLLDIKAKEQTGDEGTEDDGFIEALENEAGDVWQD